MLVFVKYRHAEKTALLFITFSRCNEEQAVKDCESKQKAHFAAWTCRRLQWSVTEQHEGSEKLDNDKTRVRLMDFNGGQLTTVGNVCAKG